MGCGCGAKRDTTNYIDNSKISPTNAAEPASGGTAVNTSAVHNAASVQPSILEGSGEAGKCPQCEDQERKKHVLDCSHGLCGSCAKQQVEEQMRHNKQGNIEFTCKTCKAPKNLSNGLLDD